MINFSIIQKSQLEGALRIDAQYFQPQYLQYEKALYKTNSFKKWQDLRGKFITGPFGSEFGTSNYVTSGHYRYIRGKDVKPFFILEEDNVYIPENDFRRLNKYSLKEGDILISVVGTLGYTAIVDQQILPSIFSCKSTVFRSKEIEPFYLITYLNSKYGYSLLTRNERGANQTGLNIDDLKTLPIYVPSLPQQKIIGQLIKNSKQVLSDSVSYYSQAEDLLLEELGLKNTVFEDELSYIVNFSDVKIANRMDAEYFQPKYQKLIEKLKIKGAKPLPEVIEDVYAGFNSYSKPDEQFKYVELSNINTSIGTIDGYSEFLGKEAPSRAKRILKAGDVIVSSVEGSLGKVALVNSDQENYLASTGFFQFRSKEILPEVILVLAKSIVLQMQFQKHCAGTILAAVPNDALKQMYVPVLGEEIQKEIADLVRKSHEARKKSKELLEEAKKKVEEMIENGRF